MLDILKKIFRKTESNTNSLFGFTDGHSHILPGVDDGVRTLDESLQILEQYQQMGIQQVWLTPHIMEEIPNTPQHLQQVFNQLQQAYQGPIQLHLSAEHMLDSLFLERLAKKKVMPYGPEGRYLLVETSYYNPPFQLHDMLQEIQRAGYHPVLAHPERYRYMFDDEYQGLHDKGVLFQLNILSTIGYYGPEAKKKTSWLIQHIGYACAGTDIHRLSMLQAFSKIKIDLSNYNQNILANE